MPQVDTWDDLQRWRYKCPHCESTNWRVHDGTFGCRRCGATVAALIDGASGERVPREEFDFVGPEAGEKAAYDPTEVVK